MKRDMDLVRAILIALSESDGPVGLDQFVGERYSRSLVGYHFRIMVEAGLIEATIQSGGNDPYYFVRARRLTWEGNDYLDAIRSESVWGETKQAISDSVGSVSFDVVKEVARAIALKAISAGLGFSL